MKFINCFLLLTLISCSTTPPPKEEGSEPFVTAGTEQFFLPELPFWADSSMAGGCFRTEKHLYLNIERVALVHNLSLKDSLKLQVEINHEVREYLENTEIKFLRPVEEIKFFNQGLEKIKAGVTPLKLYPSADVNFVWFEGQDEKWENLLKNEKLQEAPIYLFSSCLSEEKMREKVEEAGFDEDDYQYLSFDWLTPYDRTKKISVSQKLFLPEILVDKKINLYQNLPVEIIKE